jgi:antitoxin PrlF
MPSVRSDRGVNAARPATRHHEVVSVAYDAGDRIPVRPAVDPNAHPTLVTNVRRSEESHRVLVDQRLLQPGGHREPDRDVLGAVMVRIHLGEDLSHPPGELAPGDLLGDPGQREADAPQAFDGAVFCLRARPFERMLPGIRRPGGQRSRTCGAGHGVEVPGGFAGCHQKTTTVARSAGSAFDGLVAITPVMYYTQRMALAQSKLTAQGQISVPAKVRRKLGVGPGSVLEWDEDGDRVVVRRAGRYSSEEIHRKLFAETPKSRSLAELKEGIRRHMRKRHARG